MSECLLPLIEEEWKKPPISIDSASLMTPLGLAEGELLAYLEEHGATSLRCLRRHLPWPGLLVTMAAGALIRQRLCLAHQSQADIILDPILLHIPPKFISPH